MPQTQSLADHPLFEPLRSERVRRIVGLVAALLIEAILLIVLLTLNIHDEPAAAPGGVTVVDLKSQNAPSDSPEPAEQEATDPAPPTEQSDNPADPRIEPPAQDRPNNAPPENPPEQRMARSVIETPFQLPSSGETAQSSKRDAPKQAYGPVDTGSRSGVKDSEVVGTAPNGQPLYAARWYREPSDAELAGYLSTATGPGWGLIACRTAPQFRVVDCEPIAEYPQGSMINRAVLAAAWQFRVRPPMLGGKVQIGSWVRIRIDYTNRR